MSSRKSQYRKNQASLITETSWVVDMPCSYYSTRSLRCVMKEGYRKYSEYTRVSRCYDGRGLSEVKGKLVFGGFFFCALTDPMPVDRQVAKKRELESAEEIAEEEFLKLQQQMNERIARLVRLRKQKRLLQEKGLKILEKESEPEDLASMAQEEADAVVDV